MSYDEVIQAISVLLERLKKPFERKEEKLTKEQKILQKLFAHADSLHLSSNGEKWTREDLYER